MTRYAWKLMTYWRDDPDVIRVQHGPTTLWFPAGTTRAEIDKRLKAIDAATRQARKIVADPDSLRPKLPKPTRCKVPSADMMEAAGRIGCDEKGRKLQAADKPAVVMPEDMLRAGLLAQAHRTLKKWPDENPVEYAAWMERKAKLASLDTAHIEKVVASILKPGGRVVSGKYAASLVWGLEELERREALADDVWGAA